MSQQEDKRRPQAKRGIGSRGSAQPGTVVARTAGMLIGGPPRSIKQETDDAERAMVYEAESGLEHLADASAIG